MLIDGNVASNLVTTLDLVTDYVGRVCPKCLELYSSKFCQSELGTFAVWVKRSIILFLLFFPRHIIIF